MKAIPKIFIQDYLSLLFQKKDKYRQSPHCLNIYHPKLFRPPANCKESGVANLSAVEAYL